MERQRYQRYEETFKLEVVKYYFDTGEDRKKTLEKYNIDHSCLRDWLKRYDNRRKVVTLLSKIEEEMAQKFKQLPTEASEAQKEYEKLQRELELEKLKSAALSQMIDLAEAEFNLPIRKNLVPNSDDATRNVSMRINGYTVRTVWQNSTGVL